MAEKFYTILTNIGKAQLANSGVMGSKVNFVKFKIGDGNGAYYEPTENQRDLVHTVYEGNITNIETDEANPNWIKINLMIPANVGGFMIREYGLFDEEGNMLAVAKCAETYKPVAENGSTKELILRMILSVSNTKNVNLELDSTLVFATKEELIELQNKVDLNSKYKTATGSGTEIILTLGKLENGYNTTFIAIANNGGASTTVNGKKLYKPNTTTPPNITSGKAYSIWYNSASDCFFVKASAEGNAVSENVLADKTFSNDNDTGLVGAMPNNGQMSGNLNAGQSKIIPKGYTDGGTITANSLASQTAGNATAAQILAGYKAWVNGVLLNGGMVNRGAVSATLNAGGSYTIPAGYHNGSGKITANSLASQGACNVKYNSSAISIGTGATLTLNLDFTPDTFIIWGTNSGTMFGVVGINDLSKLGYILKTGTSAAQATMSIGTNSVTIIMNSGNKLTSGYYIAIKY